MAGTFALTNCGQVATCSEAGVIEDATVLVSDGVIVAVSEGQQVPPDVETIDVGGRVVTPGLIDAHTHAVFAGSRVDEYEMRAKGASYQEIASAGGGIKATMRAVRKATESELFDQSKKHADWMFRSGTTTAEMKSGYGLTLEDELKMLRVIKRLDEETPIDTQATFLGAHAVPPEFDDRAAYMDYLCDAMMPAVMEQGIAVAVDMFVEDGYFSHEDAERLANCSAGLQTCIGDERGSRGRSPSLRLRLHVDQFSTGGAVLAARLNASTADHLEQTTDTGIEALKESGTIPVLLPGSVYALGLGKYPDARKMIDEGLPVVLATDFNPGSSPTPSLPMIMSLACTQMGMTPAEALLACTKNAATALGYKDRGQIKQGTVADLVAWDVDDYREIPYFFGVDHVHTIYKNGERAIFRA
ncbi:MAG: imidazolonepropionase [Armatimonadetes bacterium]|nr:imidazolonepropionase [Armatimonadota bacterium]